MFPHLHDEARDRFAWVEKHLVRHVGRDIEVVTGVRSECLDPSNRWFEYITGVGLARINHLSADLDGARSALDNERPSGRTRARVETFEQPAKRRDGDQPAAAILWA